MTQVIIHTTDNGNVAVTVPTGELSIEAVLAKDCPKGALIVEDSTLPQGAGASFFDAWELVDGKVEVSLPKAVEITKTPEYKRWLLGKREQARLAAAGQ